MKDVCEMIQFGFACMVPVTIMGFGALQIYKQVDGWGWYLLAATLLCVSLHFKIGA